MHYLAAFIIVDRGVDGNANNVVRGRLRLAAFIIVDGNENYEVREELMVMQIMWCEED